jgi:hypothetical protein
LNTVWRAMAILSFLRKNTDWGTMERKGFDAATKPGKQEARDNPGEGADVEKVARPPKE